MTYLKFGGRLDLISDAEAKVGGYLVPFGDPQHVDLDHEYFSPQTQGVDEWFRALKVLPTLVNHDKTPELLQLLGMELPPNLPLVGPVGTLKTMVRDDKGWYVEALLEAFEKANAWYVEAVHELAKRGVLNWSSGPLQQRVRKSGPHIDAWPVIEATLTPMPANPYHSQVTPLKGILDAYTIIGTPEPAVQSALKMLTTLSEPESDSPAEGAENQTKASSSAPKAAGEPSQVEETQRADEGRATSETEAPPERSTTPDPATTTNPADEQDGTPDEKGVDGVLTAFVQPTATPIERHADHLIVKQGEGYFKVAYHEDQQGVSFAPPAEWVAVEKHWLPRTTPTDPLSISTVEQAQAQLDLLSIELNRMEHQHP